MPGAVKSRVQDYCLLLLYCWEMEMTIVRVTPGINISNVLVLTLALEKHVKLILVWIKTI